MSKINIEEVRRTKLLLDELYRRKTVIVKKLDKAEEEGDELAVMSLDTRLAMIINMIASITTIRNSYVSDVVLKKSISYDEIGEEVPDLYDPFNYESDTDIEDIAKVTEFENKERKEIQRPLPRGERIDGQPATSG